MLKKILALGLMIGMVSASNIITYNEFITGEGGRILDDIVENVAMPSDEVMQKLYDLSKNIDEGSYDIVRQVLQERWETDDTVHGYIPNEKAVLIDKIAEVLQDKADTEYNNLN